MNRKKHLITCIITTSFLLVCCAPKVQPVEPNDEETSYSNFDNKIIKRVKKNASKEVEITLIRDKSSFIGILVHATSVESVKQYLLDIRKQYPKA